MLIRKKLFKTIQINVLIVNDIVKRISKCLLSYVYLRLKQY